MGSGRGDEGFRGPVVARCPDLDRLYTLAERAIMGRCRDALRARGEFHLALAGGGTPRPLYERLFRGREAEGLDLSGLHIYWSDERCVPPDHAESNYRMARETLLDRLALPEAQIHRIHGEWPPEWAADAYERLLTGRRLDLILLGMGEDGHVASLFPGGPELEITDRRAVHTLRPNPPHKRISLTLPAINSARTVMLLVVGPAKARRLRQVWDQLRLGTGHLPAARVRPTDGELLWFVDIDAGDLLPKGNTR
jgi:6-phosphogluconolactonase